MSTSGNNNLPSANSYSPYEYRLDEIFHILYNRIAFIATTTRAYFKRYSTVINFKEDFFLYAS